VPHRDWRLRIRDILDAIQAVQDYTEGQDFEAFSKDRKTVDAVIRNITVIGEAANGIPLDVMESYPEIPWNLMRRIRNVLVHEYFGVSVKILYDTVRGDLPPLVTLLEKLQQSPGPGS
jgi:uncharacterized protein with HEPN domain